jgi:hypothetical protein
MGHRPTIACIVIAQERRRDLLDEHVLPSVVSQGFDEVVVVGQYHAGPGYRYLHVPPVVGTTLDALIKRDTGAVATTADLLVYLCDDHRLHSNFLADLHTACSDAMWGTWDCLSPSRVTFRDGEEIPLNMGKADGYIGGHGLVIKRTALNVLPWMAGRHSRIWDKDISEQQAHLGLRLAYAPQGWLAIVDIEPGAVPWL